MNGEENYQKLVKTAANFRAHDDTINITGDRGTGDGGEKVIPLSNREKSRFK